MKLNVGGFLLGIGIVLLFKKYPEQASELSLSTIKILKESTMNILKENQNCMKEGSANARKEWFQWTAFVSIERLPEMFLNFFCKIDLEGGYKYG